MTDLRTFLQYLESVHTRTRRIAVLVPPADIEWTPAPGRMTFGDIVRHLAGIERWMYAETVSGRPSRYSGHGRELADGLDAVIAYHDRLHEQSVAILGALPEERMMEKCLTPAGAPITVWKWLRLLVEHEAHHRGQLYLMLGMRGVAVPQLYGMTAEEVRAHSVPL
jgi:uncharacterized damage-inducible protein DinB